MAKTKTFDECRRPQIMPWVGDVPLMGPDVPEDNGQIVHLIRYLVTVYERFGDTRVREDITLSWGATALHKCDAQKAEIERLNDLVEDTARQCQRVEVKADLLVEGLRNRLRDTELILAQANPKHNYVTDALVALKGLDRAE